MKRKNKKKKSKSFFNLHLLFFCIGCAIGLGAFGFLYYAQAQVPNEFLQVVSTRNILATAYSSTPDQTDGSPCVTADGYNLCASGEENIIAMNHIPFGTKIRLPEVFGEKIFTVHDRMNSRFDDRIDIWMASRDKAVQFGAQEVKMEIVETYQRSVYE